MDFDYYQIKGKWKAATLNRRAEKLEEAQAAADELEEAGAAGVEIIGVKAGKRETIRGKKAPKPAKTPKAAKVRATKKKAPKATKKQNDKISEMSADDLRAIDSIFSHDGKIKILKTNTPKREPAGQLDLFSSVKKARVKFNYSEILEIRNALFKYGEPKNAFLTNAKIKELAAVFESVSNDSNIELSFNELQFIVLALDYSKKFESDWARLEKTKKLINQLLNISDTLQ